MASLNKVILIGNVGRVPELRETASGKKVATFSIATNERKDQDPEWHSIVVWEKLAENCAEYLFKGQKVLVEGRIKTKSWEDKESGVTKYKTEIIAYSVLFLSFKERSNIDTIEDDDISDDDIPF